MILDYPDVSARRLARELVRIRTDQGALALGRVLSLAVVTDEDRVTEVLEVATAATRQHPSRIIVLVKGNPRGASRLDAQIRLGGDAGASEIVVLRLYGELVDHEHAVLLPLLLPDSPIVAWWPGAPPEGFHRSPVARVASRRITTMAEAGDPGPTLERMARSYAPGDSDIAWTRVTRWRALLAAALEEPPYESVTGVTVTGGSDSPRVDLLGLWLGMALKCPVTRARSRPGEGVMSVRLERTSGPIDLVRVDDDTALLLAPGKLPRRVALPHSTLAQSLSEELHRLDVDDVYERVLGAVTKVEVTSCTASEAYRSGLAMDTASALEAEREALADRTAPRKEQDA